MALTGAWLVNTARGAIVVKEDVAEALKLHQLILEMAPFHLGVSPVEKGCRRKELLKEHLQYGRSVDELDDVGWEFV